jgi:hypothetical protein
MPKNICDTPACGEEIGAERGKHGGLPLCDRCRSAQYRVDKLGSEWLGQRRERLQFWDGRLDYLSKHIRSMIGTAQKRVAQVRKKAKAEARSTH